MSVTRAKQIECLAAGIQVAGVFADATWYVKFLEAGSTSVSKNAYEDDEKSSSITKKKLDASGKAEVFGDGAYRLEFYDGDPDASGVLQFAWDTYKVGSNTGRVAVMSGTSGTVTSDMELVIIDISTGAFTLAIDEVADFDHPVQICIYDDADYQLTINPDGTETVNGATTAVFQPKPFESIWLFPYSAADTWISPTTNGKLGPISLDYTDGTLTRQKHANRPLLLDDGSNGATLTLPDAIGSGDEYPFFVKTVDTNGYVIQVGDASHIIQGNIIANSTGDTPDLAQPWPAAADSDTVTLNGTTTGGAADGDWLTFIDVATNLYFVKGVVTASGTEANPFSAAVS
jgi:hypothetical protein